MFGNLRQRRRQIEQSREQRTVLVELEQQDMIVSARVPRQIEQLSESCSYKKACFDGEVVVICVPMQHQSS